MAAQVMGSFCVPAVLRDWQKRGWDAFAGLEQSEQSATRGNPRDSSIQGLSYTIQNCHERCANDDSLTEKIFVRIDSWTYDRGGDTTDLPVMEMIFDANRFSNPERALESLKIMARPLCLTERVAMRAVNTALFLINQIKAEQVPDFERVLELHRLHPELSSEGRAAKRAEDLDGCASGKKQGLRQGFCGDPPGQG